jgi:hypothetical protein
MAVGALPQCVSVALRPACRPTWRPRRLNRKAHLRCRRLIQIQGDCTAGALAEPRKVAPSGTGAVPVLVSGPEMPAYALPSALPEHQAPAHRCNRGHLRDLLARTGAHGVDPRRVGRARLEPQCHRRRILATWSSTPIRRPTTQGLPAQVGPHRPGRRRRSGDHRADPRAGSGRAGEAYDEPHGLGWVTDPLWRRPRMTPGPAGRSGGAWMGRAAGRILVIMRNQPAP